MAAMTPPLPSKLLEYLFFVQTEGFRITVFYWLSAIGHFNLTRGGLPREKLFLQWFVNVVWLFYFSTSKFNRNQKTFVRCSGCSKKVANFPAREFAKFQSKTASQIGSQSEGETVIISVNFLMLMYLLCRSLLAQENNKLQIRQLMIR